jgi:hypothetical protein
MYILLLHQPDARDVLAKLKAGSCWVGGCWVTVKDRAPIAVAAEAGSRQTAAVAVSDGAGSRQTAGLTTHEALQTAIAATAGVPLFGASRPFLPELR